MKRQIMQRLNMESAPVNTVHMTLFKEVIVVKEIAADRCKYSATHTQRMSSVLFHLVLVAAMDFQAFTHALHLIPIGLRHMFGPILNR